MQSSSCASTSLAVSNSTQWSLSHLGGEGGQVRPGLGVGLGLGVKGGEVWGLDLTSTLD